MEKEHHTGLCRKENITRRISQSYAAFNKYNKFWSRIPLDKKLLLYEEVIVSVMIYNSSCWDAPESMLEKLDVVHREKTFFVEKRQFYYLSTTRCTTKSARCTTEL